ncbi:MAG: Mor transcription activator family protein [Candidatus Competibacter denitrificans]
MPDSPGIQFGHNDYLKPGYNDDLANLEDCLRDVLEETKARSPDNLVCLLVAEVCARFGGLSLYIPKIEAQQRHPRDAAIRREHRNGATVRWLANRYRLTTQMIYTILDKSN